MERTIDYYGDNQDIIIANAGPGHWNDPDMVTTASLYRIVSYHCISNQPMIVYLSEFIPANGE